MVEMESVGGGSGATAAAWEQALQNERPRNVRHAGACLTQGRHCLLTYASFLHER